MFHKSSLEGLIGFLNSTKGGKITLKHVDVSVKHINPNRFARTQGDNVRGFVAEVNGRVVGYIAVSFEPDSRLGSINMASVDPDYQRKGIGSMLMEAALEFLKLRGARKVCAAVSHVNRPAIMYYMKHGFIPEGFLRDHFSKGLHEIYMSRFFEE